MAPRRDGRLERHRHRGRRVPDDRRQRLRHELPGPLRPRADRALRRPADRPRRASCRRRSSWSGSPAATRSRSAAASTTRWPATSRSSCARPTTTALSRLRRAGHADAAVHGAPRSWATTPRSGDYLTTALSMIGNCAPFDVTGHPACTVPAELVDGLPCRDDDRRAGNSTTRRCCAVAHTYEQAVRRVPRTAGTHHGGRTGVNGIHDLGGTRRARGRRTPARGAGLPKAEWEKQAFARSSRCVPRRDVRGRRLPLRHRADGPGRVPALALLRALAARRRAPRRSGPASLDLAEVDERTQYFLENPDAPAARRTRTRTASWWRSSTPSSRPGRPRPRDTGQGREVRGRRPGHGRRRRPARAHPQGALRARQDRRHRPGATADDLPGQRRQRPGRGARARLHRPVHRTRSSGAPRPPSPTATVYFDVWEPYIVPRHRLTDRRTPPMTTTTPHAPGTRSPPGSRRSSR